jgi:hypothetical protein
MIDREPRKPDPSQRRTMAPHLVLCPMGEDGEPPLPRELGGIQIWNRRRRLYGGAFEYRLFDADRRPTDRLVVILKMAEGTYNGKPCCLAQVRIPATSWAGSNPVYEAYLGALTAAGLVHASWAPNMRDVEVDDGRGGKRIVQELAFDAFEADAGPAAMAAKAIHEKFRKGKKK